MWRSRGIVAVLVLTAWFAGPALQADEKARPDAQRSKRLVHTVRHGSAKELAEALNKHFGGLVAAEPLAEQNVLLLSCTPSVVPELAALLEQIDRKPRALVVEIICIDLPPQEKAVEDAEVTGPAADLSAKLDALRKGGRIGDMKCVQLTTLEGQQASSRLGESKAHVVSVAVRATGGNTSSVSYRDVGMTVRVTPRGSGEGVVTLDLEVSESRMLVPSDGPVIGVDEKGGAIRTPVFSNVTLSSKVAVPDGRVVVAQGVKTTGKGGEGRTLILVTAKVLNGGK